MQHSNELGELASALAKAWQDLRPAKLDAVNPHFRSKYASLDSDLEAARGPLSKNGLTVVQSPGCDDKGEMVLNVMLLHSSGQWIKETVPLIVAKNDMQGFGSAISYARRYALESIIGLSTEDDDGNAATASKPREKYNAPRSQPEPIRAAAVETQVKTSPYVRTISGGASEQNKGPALEAPHFDSAPNWDEPFPEPDDQPSHTTKVSGFNVPESVVSSIGEVEIKVGKKFLGKRIKDVPLEELQSYKTWLESDSKKTKKPLSERAQEFVSAVDLYAKSFPNMNENEELPF